MSKKTLALIVSLLVVTVILLIVALSPTGMTNKPGKLAAAPTPTPDTSFTTLSFSPNPVTLSASGSGEVDVVVDTNANKISGVQLEMSFDPQVLSNVTINRGPLFTNGITFVTKPVDQVTGRIKYLIGIPYSTTTKAIQGSGTVAQIFFTKNPATPSTTTTTQLAFLDATKVTQLGVTTSVLKTASSLTINLGTNNPASTGSGAALFKPSTGSAVSH